MICTYIYLSHRCYMHIVFLLASNKCLRVVMQLEKREETTTSSLFSFAIIHLTGELPLPLSRPGYPLLDKLDWDYEPEISTAF